MSIRLSDSGHRRFKNTVTWWYAGRFSVVIILESVNKINTERDVVNDDSGKVVCFYIFISVASGCWEMKDFEVKAKTVLFRQNNCCVNSSPLKYIVICHNHGILFSTYFCNFIVFCFKKNPGHTRVGTCINQKVLPFWLLIIVQIIFGFPWISGTFNWNRIPVFLLPPSSV